MRDSSASCGTRIAPRNSRWPGVCHFQGVQYVFKQSEVFVLLFLLATSIFVVLSSERTHAIAPTFSPTIPRVWDDAEMAALQLPLVDSTASPKQISSDYYYRIPIRTIYKNYPVYEPGKEPAGYLEWLKQQEPESAFDAAALKTEADWIRAGELVFDSPISYGNIARSPTLGIHSGMKSSTSQRQRTAHCHGSVT